MPRLIPSAAPTTLGMRYGAKGPTFALASACSSATQAIGEAFEMLRAGRADRAIAGGAEACVINGSIRSWEALRVLTPDLCRPFSVKRNGMTLGEGAAVFILETLEGALARGATPLCELAGYGTTSDAFDPLRADVEGPSRCMRLALESAGLEPGDVDYLNAHGTATYANDITEFAGDARRLRRRAAAGFVNEARARPCARRKRRAGARRDDFGAARSDRAADDQFS